MANKLAYKPKAPRLRAELAVIASSLVVIGNFLWLPSLLVLLWRRARRRAAAGAGRKCSTEQKDERLNIVQQQHDLQVALLKAWAPFLLALAGALGLLLAPLRPSQRGRKNQLWEYWHEYFSTQIMHQSAGDLPAQAIYAMMPHGVYPFGQALSTVGWMSDTFRGARVAAAGAAFRVPIIRHLMGMISAIPADAPLISKVLKQGDSIALVPGGVGEMFRVDSEREVVLLRGHKGFVRQALRHGVPIVPVYVFGNSQTWRLLAVSRFLETLSRYLQTSILLPYGRWGMLIPRKVPLLFAVGDALTCERVESPSDHQVDEMHSRFIKAVEVLYDMFRDCYGWGSRPLIIQ